MWRALLEAPDFALHPVRLRGFGIPLFLFHHVTPEALKAWLTRLSRLGFRTLDADEVRAVAAEDLAPPQRAVALSFDDGVYNNWAVVAPLLRRHAMKATAFVVPRLLSEGEPRPHLDDPCGLGREALLDDEARGRYLRWEEVRRLDGEGVLRVESHGLSHARVFVSSQIVDFQRPLADGRPAWPWHWSAVDAAPGDVLWGAPVYGLASRLVARRYFDDPRLRSECVRFVADNGGPAFFSAADWRDRLGRHAERLRGSRDQGRMETPAEARAAVLGELRQARLELEARLERPIRHFAAPWSESDASTPALLREAGYRSGYLRLGPRWRLRPGCDPFRLARLEGYWIPSLPGPGRVGLGRRLLRRLQRLATR